MRLIDVDALDSAVYADWTNDMITNAEWLYFRQAMNKAPTVDAVPIEFIRSEIKNSKGFYNSSLRRLLDAWAERKEE